MVDDVDATTIAFVGQKDRSAFGMDGMVMGFLIEAISLAGYVPTRDRVSRDWVPGLAR
jgi:hypothetical protein